MDHDLQFYTGYSLVDITATGVTRYRADQEFERDQQRNWETVLQTLGLKTQPLMLQDPVCIESNLNDGWEFGETYQRRHRIWCWTFAVEHKDIYLQGNDPMAGLLADFEQVPIISGLNETARFFLPIFYPHGAIKNIYFKPGAVDLTNI